VVQFNDWLLYQLCHSLCPFLILFIGSRIGSELRRCYLFFGFYHYHCKIAGKRGFKLVEGKLADQKASAHEVVAN